MATAHNHMIDALPTFESVVKACTGRDGGLRPSKPIKADGATRYIWRQARFHSGKDPTMPVMSFFDLQAWAREHAPGAEVSGVINEAGRALLDACDAMADRLVAHFKLDRFGAAKRWRGLI